jgi:hypothetical protein
MMEVGLGAQSQVPKPRRPDEELLSAPMTREFIRGLTTEELIMVHDQGFFGIGPSSGPAPLHRRSLRPSGCMTQRLRMRPPNGCMVKAKWRENTMMIR